MVAEWQALEQEMLRVRSTVPPEQRAAYFQLVEHPIAALANLYELYYAVAWNRRLAAAGDARANVFADRAEAAFRRDQEITNAYHAVNGGKWDGHDGADAYRLHRLAAARATGDARRCSEMKTRGDAEADRLCGRDWIERGRCRSPSKRLTTPGPLMAKG